MGRQGKAAAHTARISSVQGHDASSHQIALTKCECKGKLMKNYEGDGKALNLVWKPSEHAAL